MLANGHVYADVDGAEIGETYQQPTLLFKILGKGKPMWQLPLSIDHGSDQEMLQKRSSYLVTVWFSRASSSSLLRYNSGRFSILFDRRYSQFCLATTYLARMSRSAVLD